MAAVSYRGVHAHGDGHTANGEFSGRLRITSIQTLQKQYSVKVTEMQIAENFSHGSIKRVKINIKNWKRKNTNVLAQTK